MAYSKTDYLQVRPVPFEALKSHRQLLERWYLLLTREKLPQQAQVEQWPIQEDHCLQRMVLDDLQLGQSLQLLSRMEREGEPLVAALNVSSLTFRGKI